MSLHQLHTMMFGCEVCFNDAKICDGKMIDIAAGWNLFKQKRTIFRLQYNLRAIRRPLNCQLFAGLCLMRTMVHRNTNNSLFDIKFYPIVADKHEILMYGYLSCRAWKIQKSMDWNGDMVLLAYISCTCKKGDNCVRHITAWASQSDYFDIACKTSPYRVSCDCITNDQRRM